MKTALLIILYFLNQKVMAQTVLVPEKNVISTTYFEQCQKSGYICSSDFVIEKLKSAETSKFNTLIENLDLISDSDRKKLPDDLLLILKTEMISIEQLQTLAQLAEKSLSLESNKKLDFIRNEMLDILKKLETQSEPNTNETKYLVFKKILTAEQFKNIRPLIQNYQFYKIDAFSIADRKATPTLFLNGDCNNTTYHKFFLENVDRQKIMPVFKNECTFSAEIQKSMTKAAHFVVEYKTPLIWTAVAAAAIVFAKNYDVEFK